MKYDVRCSERHGGGSSNGNGGVTRGSLLSNDGEGRAPTETAERRRCAAQRQRRDGYSPNLTCGRTETEWYGVKEPASVCALVDAVDDPPVDCSRDRN